MHKSLHSYLITAATVSILWLFSCSTSSDNGEVIAEVNGEKLYAIDIAPMFATTDDVSKEDSITTVQAFIRQWRLNKILALKARQNISDDKQDIERLVEDYRNSLLIYRYKQKLINERVDTVVSDALLLDYYKKHEDDFILTQTIVKLRFVKLPKESKVIDKAATLLRSTKPEDVSKLLQLCVTHADLYYLDDEEWLLFDDIKREIPIETFNDVLYLRNNKFVQITDEDFVYLVKFSDARFQNSPSVFEFEKESIRTIIIMERRNAFLKKMEEDLLKEYQ
jgi:hypothetical protein